MAATEAQKRYWKTPKGKAMKKAADARYYQRNSEAVKKRAKDQYDGLSDEQKRTRVTKALERPTKPAENASERQRLKLEVLMAYGGHCVCCRTSYLPHLTLDHVEGGGSAERRERKGTNLYRIARREGYPPRFQVLCWNCNWAKHTQGECGCQGTHLRLVVGGGV